MSYSGGGGSSAIHTDSDVALSNPTNGQVLSYSSSLAKWQNQTATATDTTKLAIANNLSDVASASTARTNLGLGTAATMSATAGGDLSGTLPSPTVAKVNGVSLPGTAPTSGQVLTATSGTAATWSTASEPITTIATAGTSQTLTVPASGKITYVITASASNCTSSVTGATASTPAVITLWLKQGTTGSHSWTFPAGTIYPTHTAPTLSSTAGYIDVVTLTSADGGTTWLLVPAATQAG